MKKIEAIIRSSKFEEVRETLSLNQVEFFTFMEVKGYGRQKGEQVVYRGAVYDIGYIARMKLEIVVADESVDRIVEIILRAAHTGEIGDGKVIVSNVAEMWSIRLNTRNEFAL